MSNLSKVNPKHIELLTAALRSPSAHNAQPWKIKPMNDHSSYELHYDHNDYLPEDPDDRDAYLTMGAFAENLELEAPNYGFKTKITPVFTKNGEDMYIAKVTISEDPNPVKGILNEWVPKRVTNRNNYTKQPLTQELIEKLQEYDNVLIEPIKLKKIVMEASMLSWANPRFVHDLDVWYRSSLDAPDGFNSKLMNISPLATLLIKFAFWRGHFKSKLLQRLYSTRDVSMFTAAPMAAVLAAKDMKPETLFEAGRNLLRSWVIINALGYSYHPFSIAIDEKATSPKVAAVAGVNVPVALYRVGIAKKPPKVHSNRKDLEKVII